MNRFSINRLSLQRLLLCSSLVSATSSCLLRPLSASGFCLNMSTTSTTTSNVDVGMSIGYITIPNSTLAKDLAKELVTKKLVACVNIVPTIISVYEWNQKTEEEDESLMIIKTKSTHHQAIIDFVKKAHPYKVPEVIFTSIVAGNPDYINWIDECLKKD